MLFWQNHSFGMHQIKKTLGVYKTRKSPRVFLFFFFCLFFSFFFKTHIQQHNMRFTTFLLLSICFFAVVCTSDLLNNKVEKRGAKTTTTTAPTTTTTRRILSDCPNPYVNKCGVTCCQGRQHCCPNDPTRCCNPIISQ
jgi:hypothetical protein